MTDDPRENRLHEQATQLATKLLRSPSLAMSYRDAISEAVEDSSFDQKLAKWFRDAGFTTNHAHVAAVFAAAPSTLLAFWDGVYLVQVEDRMAALQLGPVGVLLDGLKAADVIFDNGCLRFSPTETSPWQADLTFGELGWNGEGSVGAANVFQRSVKGRIWGATATRPESENAVGASKRVSLKRSAAPVRLMAALGETAVDWTDFASHYAGDYEVHWTKTAAAEPVSRHLTIAKRDEGVEVKYSQDQSTAITLSLAAQHPSAEKLTYVDNQLRFDLGFSEFGEQVRTFNGKIYTLTATEPTANNALGVFLRPEARWPADVITATALGGAAFAIGVFIPIITALCATKDTNEIKSKLAEMSHIPDGPAGLFSGDPAQASVALDNLKRDYKTAMASQTDIAGQYSDAINKLVGEIHTLTLAKAQIAKDLTDAIAAGDDAKLKRTEAEQKLNEAELREAGVRRKANSERKGNSDNIKHHDGKELELIEK